MSLLLPDAPTAVTDTLREKIDHCQARVGVVGLGYVGLPLAVAFARQGFSVCGIDLDAERAARIMAGSSYIEDLDDAGAEQHRAHGYDLAGRCSTHASRQRVGRHARTAALLDERHRGLAVGQREPREPSRGRRCPDR